MPRSEKFFYCFSTFESIFSDLYVEEQEQFSLGEQCASNYKGNLGDDGNFPSPMADEPMAYETTPKSVTSSFRKPTKTPLGRIYDSLEQQKQSLEEAELVPESSNDVFTLLNYLCKAAAQEKSVMRVMLHSQQTLTSSVKEIQQQIKKYTDQHPAETHGDKETSEQAYEYLSLPFGTVQELNDFEATVNPPPGLSDPEKQNFPIKIAPIDAEFVSYICLTDIGFASISHNFFFFLSVHGL